MTVSLHLGDCLEVLRTLEAGSVDAVVTDPPAGIAFMGKEWDSFGASPPKRSDYKAHNATTMRANGRGLTIQASQKNRDAFIAFLAERMAEARRVIRPGGYALVWALPRTSHWTAWALEEAGWVIRDRVTHLFGSGFPKSKSCLKPAAEDWWLCKAPGPLLPLEIDRCRIDGEVPSVPQPSFNSPTGRVYGMKTGEGRNGEMSHALGRWPANVTHDGSPDVLAGFPESKGDSPDRVPRLKRAEGFGYSGPAARDVNTAGFTDSGSAARFFYCAKASRRDRNEGCEGMPEVRGGAEQFDSRWKEGTGEDRMPMKQNVHPTVKPTALMQWLCRLVTPPGGTVLDPFMGSGSTGKACMLESFGFIGIEREPEYLTIARRRIDAARAETPLFAEVAR